MTVHAPVPSDRSLGFLTLRSGLLGREALYDLLPLP